MNYIYKVTLAGIKGFFRTYLINGANTLYTFHKQLQSDLEFPMDQPILFKALDGDGNVIARYAFVDLGYGTVDATKMEDTVKAGISGFVYFYDTKEKKSVIVTLVEESGETTSCPCLLESKGPVPLEFEKGYVAFEDMTDEHRHLPGEHSESGDEEDDEDFDDDEDDDKEEEELLYEES